MAVARPVVAEPGRQEMVVEFAGFAGRQRESLLDCGAMAFEDVEPVRRFRWSKGRREFAGWWWSATTGRHVGYESWLERDNVMLLDFDPRVVGVASQPFWLHWWDGTRSRRHAPDYFVRQADGTGVVIERAGGRAARRGRRASVRRDGAGLRAGGVGVPPGRVAAGGAGEQCALAVAVSASPVRPGRRGRGPAGRGMSAAEAIVRGGGGGG